MDCKDLIVDGLNRVGEDFRRALDGLTPEQLGFRPAEHADSVAGLACPLTRVMDEHGSELAGAPQGWIQDGWHARFGKPGDMGDTGFGYTAADVAGLRPESAELLLEYFGVVFERSVAYVRSVSCADMDR